MRSPSTSPLFFFNDTATTEIYTFPYTTLFRSTTTLKVLAGLLPAKNGRICFRGQDVTNEPSHKRVERKLSLIPEERQLWPDRKSTRLNSSHGYISYAVFCLKKKKRE